MCPTLCDPMDYSPPGSSVHGIFQAWILEWVAISFSRGSFGPRDRTQVSPVVGRRFTVWATREALLALRTRSKIEAQMIMRSPHPSILVSCGYHKNCHEFGSFKQQKFSHSSGGQYSISFPRPESRCWQDYVLPGISRGEFTPWSLPAVGNCQYSFAVTTSLQSLHPSVYGLLLFYVLLF